MRFNRFHDMGDTHTGNGKAAYRGRWIGNGQQIEDGDTVDTLLRKADLTWTAEKVPVQFLWNGELKTDTTRNVIVRHDDPTNVTPHDGQPLSVMTQRYYLHQPRDWVEFVHEYITADGRFAIDALAPLKGGRMFVCIATYRDPDIKVLGEPHKAAVMFLTSYDGTFSSQGLLAMLRLQCLNQVSSAMYSANREGAYVRIPHTLDFSDAQVKADAYQRLTEVIAGVDKYRHFAEALARVRMSGEEIEALFTNLTIAKTKDAEAPTGRARAALERLLQSYRDTLNEGTERNTAWAALNAVTRYVDHNRTVRDTAGDGKALAQFQSGMIGSGAALKTEAIKALAKIGGLELAA